MSGTHRQVNVLGSGRMPNASLGPHPHASELIRKVTSLGSEIGVSSCPAGVTGAQHHRVISATPLPHPCSRFPIFLKSPLRTFRSLAMSNLLSLRCCHKPDVLVYAEPFDASFARMWRDAVARLYAPKQRQALCSKESCSRTLIRRSEWTHGCRNCINPSGCFTSRSNAPGPGIRKGKREKYGDKL